MKSTLSAPLHLLQVHKVHIHHLHQKFGNYPPVYNHHGGGWTIIPICLGSDAIYVTVAVSTNLNVIINIDLKIPNSIVDLEIYVVVNLNLDVPKWCILIS